MTNGTHSTPARGGGLLQSLLRGIDRLGQLDGWLGALCLTTMTCLILAEVLVRFISTFLPWFPSHIPVAWEYGSYLMAASFTFGAAMTLRAGAHIRVNLLLANAGPDFRRGMEIIAASAGVLFTGFLAFAMVGFSLTSLERGTSSLASGTPLWIPQLLISFGILLMAAQFLARLIRAIIKEPLEDHALRPQTSME